MNWKKNKYENLIRISAEDLSFIRGLRGGSLAGKLSSIIQFYKMYGQEKDKQEVEEEV